MATNLNDDDPTLTFDWDTPAVTLFVQMANTVIRDHPQRVVRPSWLRLNDRGVIDDETLKHCIVQEWKNAGDAYPHGVCSLATETLSKMLRLAQRMGQMEIDPFLQTVMRETQEQNREIKYLLTISMVNERKEGKKEPLGPGPVPPTFLNLFG